MKKNKNKKGFTLIEVLAVIILLAVVTSISIVAYNKYFKSSELATGQNQALIIKDAVAKYVSEQGDLPLLTPGASYTTTPSPIDMSKIKSSLNGSIVKGNYYVYGQNGDVYYDLPVPYIQQIYNNYPTKTAIVKNNYVDTEKLFTDGIITYKPYTKYMVDTYGKITQVADNQKMQSPVALDPGGTNAPGSVTNNGAVKPALPTITPSKNAPYYDDGKPITFTANSFSQKGEVTYKWTGLTPNNIYTVGSYTIQVIAVDIDGKESDPATFTFTVQSTNSINKAPTIPTIVINPGSGPYNSAQAITFTATSTDPENDPITYKWVGLNSNNKYPGGSHLVSVTAVDSKGNYSPTATYTFTIVNTKPIIESVDVKPNPISVFDVPTITPKMVDADNDMVDFEYQGKSATGKYTVGTHNLQVRAKDAKGTYSDWYPFTLTVINRPPTMPSLSMSPSTMLRPNTYITFTGGTSVDPDGDNVTYEWKVDNGNWDIKKPDGTFPSGSHTVYYRANDGNGGIAQNSVSFSTLNNPPNQPSISMSPATNLYSNTNITFTAFAIDPDGDPITYEWNKDGAGWSTTSPNGTFTVGNHTVDVRAKDSIGAVSQPKSISFTVINSNPSQVTISINPVKSSYLINDNLTFNRTNATDVDGDAITYQWSKDNATWTNLPPNGTFPTRGTYTIYVKASDTRGGSSLSQTSFVVGNSAPTVPNYTMNPSATSDIRSNTVISYTIGGSTDLENDAITYEYSQDGSPYTTVSTSGTLTFAVGDHTILVRAKDSLGATSVPRTVTFTVNNTAPSQPTITMSPVAGADNRSNTYITFTASGSTDVDGDTVSYEWNKDNAGWTTTSPNGTFSVGSHTVQLRAKDSRGGYSATATATFTINNTVPTTPTLTMSPASGIRPTTTVTFTASSSDVDGDTVSYEWKKDNGAWSSTKADGTFTTGSHTVYVRAVDSRGGYSAESSKTFSVTNPISSVDLYEDFEDGVYNLGGTSNGYVSYEYLYGRGYYSNVWRTYSIGNYGSTGTYLYFNVPDGATNAYINFDYAVGSEACCDPVSISIDGSTNVVSGIRGTTAGNTGNIPLNPGNHYIYMSFSTDVSILSYNNGGMIDNIHLHYNQNNGSLLQNFPYTGNVVYWTVPSTDTYTIETYGAQGGSSSWYQGGLGAKMKGEFNLTQGQVLKILVGGQGGTGSYVGGGGGGTFVTLNDNTPLIISGAGGGASYSGYDHSYKNATTSTSGMYGISGGNGQVAAGAGGSGGYGGGSRRYYSYVGSGGGGLYGWGTSGDPNDSQYAGRSFTSGGYGGSAHVSSYAGSGGFGGGGGGDWYSMTGAGGGGGYSGGGGGEYYGVGGGGGSYNGGANQANSSAFQSGNGLVKIFSNNGSGATGSPQSFAYSGSINYYTVPATGTYYLEAYGSQGGSSATGVSGGRGAKMSGYFTLNQGDSIKIIVGGAGSTPSYAGGSGGGGSFIFRNNSIILAAGGGGGGSHYGYAGIGGTTGNNGTNDSNNYTSGGSGGYGGNVNGYWAGGGGAGIYGYGSTSSSGGGGGTAINSGAYGGNRGSSYGANGGFGGGGGSSWAPGGGGGFSGGASGYSVGNETYGGGGGGSYNAGYSQNNQSDYQAGNGLIRITPY